MKAWAIKNLNYLWYSIWKFLSNCTFQKAHTILRQFSNVTRSANPSLHSHSHDYPIHTACLNQTVATSLVDLFLVRISGSRWKTDRQAVSCSAIWSIMLASFFSVGENSTCLLHKGTKVKAIRKSQNPLDSGQNSHFQLSQLTLSPSSTTLTLSRGFGALFPSPFMALDSSCSDHFTFNLNASSTIRSIFSV